MTAAYWYEHVDTAVEVLRAVRRLREADRQMRRRMSIDMDMNATDLDALRFIIRQGRTGTSVTPRSLASHLEISTASTTKLLDRLTRSGHLRREPHPRDRRSVTIVATGPAHGEVRDRLGRMHEEMLAAAEAVPEDARGAVVAFLDAMAQCLAEGEEEETGEDGNEGSEGNGKGPDGAANGGTPSR